MDWENQIRAFAPPAEPQQEVTINLAALTHITDIAHKVWSENKSLNQAQVLFMALERYMLLKGAKPNFKVSL